MFIKFKILRIAFILLMLSILIQCGKSTNPNTETNLIGIWIWKNSSGGIAGETRTPQTEGYSITLSFNPDSTFTRTKSDADSLEILNSTYSIRFEEITFLSQIDSGYVLYMENAEPALIQRDGLTLALVEMCADCFARSYERLTE